MMDYKQIMEMPTSLGRSDVSANPNSSGWHESCLRAYHILAKVKMAAGKENGFRSGERVDRIDGKRFRRSLSGRDRMSKRARNGCICRKRPRRWCAWHWMLRNFGPQKERT